LCDAFDSDFVIRTAGQEKSKSKASGKSVRPTQTQSLLK
jgi:hypothetical protein